MAIETVEFDLSMASPETGQRLTARAYTVDGITNTDGSLRELSIGQPVMALCLERASRLEAEIIALMETMNETSAQLESLTEIEQEVVDFFSNTPNATYLDITPGVVQTGAYAGASWHDALFAAGVISSTVYNIRNDRIGSAADVMYNQFVTDIEANMDSKNSFSQQKMIELQSQTSKRDQAYDMISNILKSINTVLVGNVNNM